MRLLCGALSDLACIQEYHLAPSSIEQKSWFAAARAARALCGWGRRLVERLDARPQDVP